MKRRFVSLLVVCLSIGSAGAQQQSAKVGSHPDTIVRGRIPANLRAAIHVKPGQTVAIDTLSHQGMNSADGPIAFFGKGGIPSEGVLKDAVDVFNNAKPGTGAGGHILTGPVYIDGAEPGDQLEVRIVDVQFRVPYGVNATNKGSGVLPDLLSESSPRIIRLDLQHRVALFGNNIEVPLSPFMGVMAVAPPPDQDGGSVSSRPPGAFGGNLDLKQLGKGATLYLPVFNSGAQFFTGDAHGGQGDGEVDGTAIEMSLTPTLQFMVNKGKGKSMIWPRAETPTHYIAMGMDKDLNVAMKAAVQETVDFLIREKGLSPAEAYSLASIGCDFHVGEAVNLVQVVYGMIPKAFFKTSLDYWYKP
jgi:acetamidase/formamidase